MKACAAFRNVCWRKENVTVVREAFDEQTCTNVCLLFVCVGVYRNVDLCICIHVLYMHTQAYTHTYSTNVEACMCEFCVFVIMWLRACVICAKTCWTCVTLWILWMWASASERVNVRKLVCVCVCLIVCERRSLEFGVCWKLPSVCSDVRVCIHRDAVAEQPSIRDWHVCALRWWHAVLLLLKPPQGVCACVCVWVSDFHVSIILGTSAKKTQKTFAVLLHCRSPVRPLILFTVCHFDVVKTVFRIQYNFI